MPHKPTLAQLIRHIAQKEALELTRAHFSGLSDKRLRALLWEAASLLESPPLPFAEPPLPAHSAQEAKEQKAAQKAVQEKKEARVAPAARAGKGDTEGQGRRPPTTSPARPAFVRIYSDGASRGNPGPAGAGAFLVDEGGKPLERLGRYLGEQTNNQAEYEGALLGLKRARARGALHIELLSDSQLLIRQLTGRYRVKHPGLLPLHREALALLGQFAKVALRHIPREENGEADAMSNRAIDERMGV